MADEGDPIRLVNRSRPLSWHEARQGLREVLENYLDDPLIPRRKIFKNLATSQQSAEGTARGASTSAGTKVTTEDGDDEEEDQHAGGLGNGSNVITRGIARLLSWWVSQDLDLYVGALSITIALLVLAALSLVERKRNEDGPFRTAANVKIYQSQVAASSIFFLGSVVSMWMIRRRRFLCLNDSDNVKKREIFKFLAAMESYGSTSLGAAHDFVEGKDSFAKRFGRASLNSSKHPQTKAVPSQEVADHALSQIPSLAGTALTDIYPVYRLIADGLDEDGQPLHRASWTRIPSLLLVKGDYIALQVGDIAPANCVVAEVNHNFYHHHHHHQRHHHRSHQDQQNHPSHTATPASMHASSHSTAIDPVDDYNGAEASAKHHQYQVACGDRISLASFGETAHAVAAHLPKGRTTLPPDSPEYLLALCNHMRIFIVIETPLQEFIRRQPAESKPSQVWRQIRAAREALTFVAPVFLILTSLVVFVRPDATSGDLSLILTLPLLATVGVLPVVAPAFGFFVEVVGTARILTTVHPFALLRKTNDDYDQQLFPQTKLLFRYVLATAMSRLSLWEAAQAIRQVAQCLLPQLTARNSDTISHPPNRSKLVRVPPASISLLEKLGVCTAFAIVDDELACEPHAIPQQLLIPSGNGLKLLDLCPAHDNDDSENDSDSETGSHHRQRARGKSFDSDSDSEDALTSRQFHSNLRSKVLRRRRHPKLRREMEEDGQGDDEDDTADTEGSSFEVQFEDPLWWQHLPSLKCVGLSCLLIDNEPETSKHNNVLRRKPPTFTDINQSRASLAKLITAERRSHQLVSLAECIGFSTDENSYGKRGDISFFTECLRLHVLSSTLFKERVEIDAHERSSEQSRWWGLIRPDSTSVIVHDARSGAYQLLTVGDPLVVTSLCNEAWQGEISTILPFSAIDRTTIMETSENWKLADLDVAAFSYAPVPLTLENRLNKGNDLRAHLYLLDHGDPNQPLLKDKNVSDEWSLIKNQVFLGVLGSHVAPRREIQKLLAIFSEAGVRFVYFSPRNMRRQKELASQMGIDVAWNCAISLRPLEVGEDDPHRMVSNYADWDVNAKLPHGVEDVRKHLKEVDNVPLLVSLYTDVTKKTTREMVEIFQEYSDTVIAVGLSHLPQNDGIFSSADIGVGIDVLTENVDDSSSTSRIKNERDATGHVLPPELEFVSAISSHACAFRFRSVSSISHLSTIIEQARAALEAAIAGGVFLISGSLSFSFYVLFSACTPATTICYVHSLGAMMYLQIILPGIGLTMAMTESEENTMRRVPAKNDERVTFGRGEGWRHYRAIFLKAIPPALLPQILHLIVFGELVIYLEPDLVASKCSGASSWVHVIRCDALKHYSGPARTSSGAVVLAEFILCIVIGSASFVHRFLPLHEQNPCTHNHAWAFSSILAVAVSIIFAALEVHGNAGNKLPWYFYVLALALPWICLVWNEFCKQVETKQEIRAEKLRRLQFETRLGAWSPK